MAKDLVEFVDIALVLHQRGAGEVIEILHVHIDDLFVHRLHQQKVFLQGDGHFGFAQLIEEVQEHGRVSSIGLTLKIASRSPHVQDDAGKSKLTT